MKSEILLIICIQWTFLIGFIPAQIDSCLKEYGQVTLSTSCPSACTLQESNICILYPRNIPCIDAEFGNCQTFNIDKEQCQVHCIYTNKEDTNALLEIIFNSTTRESKSITAPITHISELILPKHLKRLFFSGIQSNVTFHPNLLSASTNLNEIIFYSLSIEHITKGALPLNLNALSLSNLGLQQMPEDISNMAKLEFLILSENRLTQFPKEILSLKTLKSCDLEGNLIDQVVLSHSEFSIINGSISVHMDPIPSKNCPQNTTRTKWSKMYDDEYEVVDENMVDEFYVCINNNKIIQEETESTVTPKLSKDEAFNHGKEEKESISATLVVYIIVASLMIVSLFVIFFIWIRQKRKKCNNLCEPLNPFMELKIKEIGENKQEFCATLENRQTFEAWRLSFENIQFSEKIATGGYGIVYKAKYQNQEVAVKTLFPTESCNFLSSIADFSHEIEFSMDLKHRSIVSMIGVAWSNAYDLCAVVEYMDQGDLHQVLSSKSPLEMNWKIEKWSIMVSIAEALLYLHSRNPPIIHRDLKSRNVLLDSIKGTKLSDFGLSRYRKSREDDSSMTGLVGTVRWMAPELLAGEIYTEKVDIYAFGLILSELSTHQLPFEHLNENTDTKLLDAQIACLISSGSSIPSFGDNYPECIRKLGEKCISYKEIDRPSSAELMEALHGMIRTELEDFY